MAFYRTGSLLLDLVVGGDKGVLGFPKGVIVNIIGDKSSGKSLLKNEIVATNYHKYGKKFKWFLDDSESGDTFNTERIYGVDLHPHDDDSYYVEELDAKLSKFLTSLEADEFGIYAVDSLDGISSSSQLDSQEERLKKYNKGEIVSSSDGYGMHLQKFLSQSLFRGQHKQIKNSNSLLIVVSQTRTKIDSFGFGEKWSVSGGKALEFYSHTRLLLKHVCHIKQKEKNIGIVTKIKTIKSKTPRPFRECLLTSYFDYGIDNIGSCVDYLFDLRDEKTGKLDIKKSAGLVWEGEKERLTRSELIKLCEEQKAQYKILEKRVTEKWEGEEDGVKLERSKKSVLKHL